MLNKGELLVIYFCFSLGNLAWFLPCDSPKYLSSVSFNNTKSHANFCSYTAMMIYMFIPNIVVGYYYSKPPPTTIDVARLIST